MKRALVKSAPVVSAAVAHAVRDAIMTIVAD
jgi:hypothetical protein